MSTTTAIPASCGYCGRPVTSDKWADGFSDADERGGDALRRAHAAEQEAAALKGEVTFWKDMAERASRRNDKLTDEAAALRDVLAMICATLESDYVVAPASREHKAAVAALAAKETK